jgi:anti-sigma factor RsiW
MESNDQNPTPSAAELMLDEAESLIWSLLDDRIEDADLARLTKLLEEDAAVRWRYVECVQLHVDLQQHFGRPAAGSKPAPCVLGHLPSGFAAESFPPVGQ